ncbi:MAG: energy transducer TonB [Cytophagaceae bacterium]
MNAHHLLLSSYFSIGICVSSFSQTVTSDSTQSHPNKSVSVEETVPQFYQGDTDNAHLKKYVLNQIVVPSIEGDSVVKGVMEVWYVVNMNGYVKDVVIRKGISPTLNAEVLRVFNTLPVFYKPGMYDGKAVSMKSFMEIEFPLR